MDLLTENLTPQEEERSEKLLKAIDIKNFDKDAEAYLIELSKLFAHFDIAIPSADAADPSAARDVMKLELMRILVKQNFMMIKQLETLSKKMDYME